MCAASFPLAAAACGASTSIKRGYKVDGTAALTAANLRALSENQNQQSPIRTKPPPMKPDMMKPPSRALHDKRSAAIAAAYEVQAGPRPDGWADAYATE